MLTRMVLAGRSPGYRTYTYASPQSRPLTASACYRTSYKWLRCSPLSALAGVQSSSGRSQPPFGAPVTLAAQRQYASSIRRTIQCNYTPPTLPSHFTKVRSGHSPRSVQPSYPWRSLTLRGRRPGQPVNYRPVQTGSDADSPVDQSEDPTGGTALLSAHATQIPTEELQHNAEELYRVTREHLREQAPKV